MFKVISFQKLGKDEKTPSLNKSSSKAGLKKSKKRKRIKTKVSDIEDERVSKNLAISFKNYESGDIPKPLGPRESKVKANFAFKSKIISSRTRRRVRKVVPGHNSKNLPLIIEEGKKEVKLGRRTTRDGLTCTSFNDESNKSNFTNLVHEMFRTSRSVDLHNKNQLNNNIADNAETISFKTSGAFKLLGKKNKPKQKISFETLKLQAPEGKRINRKRNQLKPLYEPKKHGTRTIKRWQKENKRKWHDLDVQERIRANAEMKRVKEQGLSLC